MEKLFMDIGKKIMTVSKIYFVLLTIVGVATGMVFVLWGYNMDKLLGIVIIIASPFVAYLSTILHYGFGKLVDSAEIIEKRINKNDDNDDDLINHIENIKRKMNVNTVTQSPDICDDSDYTLEDRTKRTPREILILILPFLLLISAILIMLLCIALI